MINFIDLEKCTGCGTCFKSCSLDVFRIDTDQKEISPCMAACPAGTNIRAYNALLQQGKLAEALETLRENNPFPALTGRICFHPCESECSRASVDGAVNINGLEQFLGDMEIEEQLSPIRHIAKIAIIGSGPAGLSAALYLARLGYPVTIFEAQPEPGGMLRYGIPAYRLPDSVIEKEIKRLEKIGVEIRCNSAIGSSPDLSIPALREQGYKAFILAPGASQSRKLDIPGADLPGVLWGVEFLRAIRSGKAPHIGKSVIVVGGGDVAVDAAISSRKLGAKNVTMVSLESLAELPAYPHNQADAKNERVKFECGWGPVKILGKDKVNGLLVKRCLAVKDENGAFRPAFDESVVKEIPADTIIFAIGQKSDLEPFCQDVEIGPRNLIEVNRQTMGTSAKDIFAAGDAATGPASAISAIAQGREAAISADRYLRGAHIHSNRSEKGSIASRLPGEGVLAAPRNERQEIETEGFAERRQGFDLHSALAESMRCMTCGAKAKIAYNDDCMTCYTCELRCPSEAINVHPFKEVLPRTLEINVEVK